MGAPESERLVAYLDVAIVQQSSTLLSDRGNRTYINSARRIISGEVLKYRNEDRWAIPRH